MSAKIFLSWSGETSRSIAKILQDWLPAIIQSVDPYFTPQDIAKGAKWNSEISKILEKCSFGIICLTKENLSAPWIMFEAGALSKNLKESRVCPILFNINPNDMPSPLQQFQAVAFQKNDIFSLLESINESLGTKKIPKETLQKSFSFGWPQLEIMIENIVKEESVKELNQKEHSDNLILNEIKIELLELRKESQQQRMISRTALEHLANIFCDVVDNVISTGTDIRICEKISEMHNPIQHLANRAGLMNENTEKRLLYSSDQITGYLKKK